MSHKLTDNRVNILSLVALVIVAVDYLHGFFVWSTLNENLTTLMSLNGLEAIISLPNWYFHALYATQILVLFLLLLGVVWARYLFVALVVWIVASTLLFGVGISLPLQMLFGTLESLMYGAILLAIVSDLGLARAPLTDSADDE